MSMTKEQVLAVLDKAEQSAYAAAYLRSEHQNAQATVALRSDIREARAAIASWPEPASEPGEAVAFVDMDDLARHKREGGGGGVICGTYSERYHRTTPLYAAPPSMSALLAELRGLKTYDITEGGGVYESDRGDIIDWHELAAILSRYPEAK